MMGRFEFKIQCHAWIKLSSVRRQQHHTSFAVLQRRAKGSLVKLLILWCTCKA